MQVEKIEQSGFLSLVNAKVKDYAQLIKFRLSLLVVFSSGMGYLMGTSGNINWENFFLLCLGGLLTTGSANAINQVIEKDFDRLMKRTANRPLPTERMSSIE